MKDLETPAQDYVISRGMKFPLNEDILPKRMQRILRTGNYAPNTFAAIKKMVRPDDVVLELGAGLGFMSTVMATKCAVANIHVYEANPRMIPFVKEVHLANDVETVTLTHAMVGTKKTTKDFYVRPELAASSPHANSAEDGDAGVEIEKVNVYNFKTIMKKIKPTFLVYNLDDGDTEFLKGADLSGLRGAVIGLQMERDSVQNVFDALGKAGLTFYPKTSQKKVAAFLKDW